jgi:polyphosphate glucokinase
VKVLVVDVGGNNVKLLATGHREVRKVPSGPRLTPARMVAAVRKATADWSYNAVAIGFPAPVRDGRIVKEPFNLGRGWVRFDFRRAFRRPVRIINDAVMQALGSYRGGRLLFLGLGTGLGAALVLDGLTQPLEIAHLPYRDGWTYEDLLGKDAYDEVVLGGGNSKLLDKLPRGCRLGDNKNAFAGGFRLWKDEAPAPRRRRR